jgi:hypothetical protein
MNLNGASPQKFNQGTKADNQKNKFLKVKEVHRNCQTVTVTQNKKPSKTGGPDLRLF